MTVAILGVGLIGGSIGKGLMHCNYSERILGLDTCAETLSRAIETKCIHDALDIRQHAKEVDLWVLAADPIGIVSWLERLPSLISDTAVVTDVCGVKQSISSAVPSSMAEQFVGGHPVAGKQRGGIENADACLFEGAAWVICPERASAYSLRKVEQLIYALDAVPVPMSPADHDLHLALLSHAPNILANILWRHGSTLPLVRIAGGSWQDLTRVAGGDPALWEQVLLHNREFVADELAKLCEDLRSCEVALRNQDHEALHEIFRVARDLDES